MLHYVIDDYHDYPTLMKNSTKLNLYKTSNIDEKQEMFYKINNESDFPFLIILHIYKSEGSLQFRLIYKIVSSEDEYKPIEFLHSFSALRYGNSLNISFKEIFSLFGQSCKSSYYTILLYKKEQIGNNIEKIHNAYNAIRFTYANFSNIEGPQLGNLTAKINLTELIDLYVEVTSVFTVNETYGDGFVAYDPVHVTEGPKKFDLREQDSLYH